MKKLWLFCLCLLIGALVLTRLPNRADKTQNLSRSILLLNANNSGWVLSRLNFFSHAKDGSYLFLGKTDKRTGIGEVKEGYLLDVDKEGVNQNTKKRLRQLFSVMEQENIAQISKENIGYIFFEQGGIIFNKGNVFVYTADESKWNPILYRSKQLTKPYKFERINAHWYKAKQ